MKNPIPGSPPTFTRDFPAGATFEGVNNARAYLKSIGCSNGSMCANEPIAVMRDPDGTMVLGKWYHYTNDEKSRLDGWIEPIVDFRIGGARVCLRFNPEAP